MPRLNAVCVPRQWQPGQCACGRGRRIRGCCSIADLAWPIRRNPPGAAWIWRRNTWPASLSPMSTRITSAAWPVSPSGTTASGLADPRNAGGIRGIVRRRRQTVDVIGDYGTFSVGDLQVLPFPVPHDAREPSQYVFSDGTPHGCVDRHWFFHARISNPCSAAATR